MRNRRVLFVQHGETDRPGLLGEVLSARGVAMDVLRPDLGEPIPVSLDAYSGLALGGGAQGAYEIERYPFLGEEIRLVREAAAREKAVIGLCLGGQLMAAALGAEVRPAPRREIGFFPVTLEPLAQFDPVWGGMPAQFVTTHWHGDEFDVPPGGMRMGRSDLTPNQLFRYGASMYGLQFHLEMTPEVLDAMIADSGPELRGMGVDPEELVTQGQQVLPQLRGTAETVFSRWSEFL
jgi:GMP synthase (glutamine-hydrolysing)